MCSPYCGCNTQPAQRLAGWGWLRDMCPCGLASFIMHSSTQQLSCAKPLNYSVQYMYMTDSNTPFLAIKAPLFLGWCLTNASTAHTTTVTMSECASATAQWAPMLQTLTPTFTSTYRIQHIGRTGRILECSMFEKIPWEWRGTHSPTNVAMVHWWPSDSHKELSWWTVRIDLPTC